MLDASPVRASDSDQRQTDREQSARTSLLDAGASSLPRAPWLRRSQPASAVDLVRFAVWRGQDDKINDDEVLAALTLLPVARAEMEQLETALLFIARTQGQSWRRIAQAMGLGSPQAALQRFDRLRVVSILRRNSETRRLPP
jgi:hypothetical protein